jgi:O-antigen/teichoic acid export membrane protein
MSALLRWLQSNSVMLSNAVSLMGTTVVTSTLGFVYWWAAARYFPTATVGTASASISAMTLLGGFCMMGLGTLLITELPRQPGHGGELISTALIVVGGVGAGVGVVFALVASYVSPAFRSLSGNILDICMFAAGVSFTATALVLDQALIGLLRGKLQFWRNAIFSVIKLAALFVAGLLLPGKDGMTIYATWVGGNMLSLVALVGLLFMKRGRPGRRYLPQWSLLRKSGLAALQHHLLNLSLQASVLLLPVIVTAQLSPTMNARFYIALMLAGFVFLLPNTLTIVLHAMNSAQQTTLPQKARMTIGLSFAAGILTNCLFQFTAPHVLAIFGSSYIGAAPCLRILLLAVFPLIIRNHYISVNRIRDRVTQAMFCIIPAAALEVIAAIVGARIGDLTGLSAGWVAALGIESLFMLRTVYRTALPARQATPYEEQDVRLIDTFLLPALSPGYGGASTCWLVDTMPLPMLGPIMNFNDQIRHPSALPPPPLRTLPTYSGPARLRPTRLEPYLSLPPVGIPITDPMLDGQLFEQEYGTSLVEERK